MKNTKNTLANQTNTKPAAFKERNVRFKAMAKEGEDWADFDATLLDGLEEDDIEP